MRIVTDGELFAIEKGWIFKRYFDLKAYPFWWSSDDEYFNDCWGSRQQVEKRFNILTKKRNIRPVGKDES